VVIPTYNAAHWLPQAVDSVLAQQFRDFELLVLDNASTENMYCRYGPSFGLGTRVHVDPFQSTSWVQSVIIT